MPEEQEEQELNINQVTPEEVLEDLLQSAETHAAATQAFTSNLVFYGKSLDEWSQQLAVPIPNDPSPEDMRRLFIKVGNNIQRASHFLSVSKSINTTLQGGGRVKKADIVKAIVDNYAQRNARRPAATVIETMADSYLSNTVNSRIASKVVLDFWKERLSSLREVRKILEQIGINMHTEMKYLDGGGGGPDENPY